MFYLIKAPAIFQWLYPNCVWKIPNSKNNVYLTFDDGPSFEVSTQTLKILKAENIKATFFCMGKQIEKHPEIYKQIILEGHAVGNHTFDHPNGWITKNKQYFKNVEKCQNLIRSTLFRPPYGKMKFSQVKHLKSIYKIIMWDVIGGDFDPKTSANDIVNNVVSNSKSGSIIVLHDSRRFGEKMLAALPQIITKLKMKGFNFSTILPFHQ